MFVYIVTLNTRYGLDVVPFDSEQKALIFADNFAKEFYGTDNHEQVNEITNYIDSVTITESEIK